MEIELFLRSKRRKNLGNGVGNFSGVIAREKAVPESVGIGGGSESGGDTGGATNVLRRSEGEYVSDAAFR